MAAKIIPLGSAAVETDRKADFLRHLSAAYDAYVEKTGREPVAVLHMLGGPRSNEPRSLGWLLTAEGEGFGSAWLALGLAEIQAEFNRED